MEKQYEAVERLYPVNPNKISIFSSLALWIEVFAEKRLCAYKPQNGEVVLLRKEHCPVSMISKEQVHDLYSLRWQIELLLKTWKSVFSINQVKKMNVNRLKCAIYGRLITIFILSTTIFEIQQYLYNKQKNEISEQKALSTLKPYLVDFYDAFLKHLNALQALVYRLIIHIGKTCKKSRKNDKNTCLDILLNLGCL